LVKIDLPLETLNQLRPGLEDLRLFDDQGKEIPFAIDRPIEVPRRIIAARDFRTEIENDRTRLFFRSGSALPISGLTLETPARDFIKAITIEASPDGNTWRTLVRNQPFFRHATGVNRVFLDFESGGWRYFRCTIDDRRSTPVPITGVQFHESEAMATPQIPVDLKISQQEDTPGESRWGLELPSQNLLLAGLALDTSDVLFQRSISLSIRQLSGQEVEERIVHQAVIFRMAVDDQDSVSNVWFASDLPLKDRELVLKIDNGDSPPLTIRSIRAYRRPVHLIFLANQKGSYHLLSGNTTCPSPRYDLANRMDQLRKAPLLSLSPETLTNNPAFKPTDHIPEITLGNPLDVSAWKYRKEVRLPAAGASQVELDLEVLSRTRSLADLRLLSAEQQLPFLVERTSLIRPLAPVITVADDPKRPRVSRWEMLLPKTGLPVTKVTLTTDAGFFRREVRLLEERKNELGDPYQVFHGHALWTKTPEQKPSPLTLGIESLQSDRLILEIDNADNPPLRIHNVQAWHRVTRLLFKTPPALTNLHLYYGNPRVSSPTYDLELVGAQLLRAKKTNGTLGQEVSLKGESWFAGDRLPEKSKYLFWAILLIVGCGLIYVMARMLPKAASDSPPP